MSIQILTNSEKSIKAADVMRLYRDAGWWREREEGDIELMLASGPSVGAWDGEALIGFARAVADGKFRAYIEDVVIHSAYQRDGIGTQLVSRLLEILAHIDVISLFCEPHLIPFYEKNNFRHSKSQNVMHLIKR
ncbi:GNAT family N-acetyltransferase [Neobacillus piezotolerans]|uniref:GNAT family N-acetyltransferase n=1 Tax=Neobacillus piezotolerans TaxID=2259171 RepID=A0A3D8GTL2_9BACI|nr:GNAT family N-acetyltransferase [Neobacillus piezotolerans]RDU37810.1 GNAT family N-acetyltransferase [Neobacillus piezotolerans]